MSPYDLLVAGRLGFVLREFRYYSVRLKKLYYPTGRALKGLQLTTEMVLLPMREHFDCTVDILSGGGYDPVYDPDTGEYATHRGSPEEPSRTQHRHGAVDFRLGTSHATPWRMRHAWEYLNGLLDGLGVTGALGLYLQGRNLFIHVDLRPGARRLYFNETINGTFDRSKVELWEAVS